MKLWDRVVHRSVPGLVRVACLLALLALALVCWSILDPRPIPVILAMSLGHVMGGAAFACYLLAIILDAMRRPPSNNNAEAAAASPPVGATKHNRSLGSSPSTNT